MIRRLICILRKHQGPRHRRPIMRREWVDARGRVVWMTTCFHCGVQLDEGNSDSWIIPDWIARDLMENARKGMESVLRMVLRA